MSAEGFFELDEDTVAALLRRAQDRIDRGERPQHLALPEDKAGFPKLLCLDLNKWIDLARAHYGRPDGAPFRTALAAVRKAVDLGRLVVPVTGANALEVMQPGDVERRRRLAAFMVDLSRNHSLVNDTAVIIPEMRHAVLRRFAGKEPTSPIRSILVQRGMTAAIAGRKPLIHTGNEAMDLLLTDAAHEPEVSVEALVHTATRAHIASFRRQDEDTNEIVAQVRQIDAHLKIEERRRLEFTNLLRDGALADLLRSLFTETRVDAAPFFNWLWTGENVVRFVQDVPGIDVMATLMLYRDRNREHATHRNDGRDFSFLKVAIPYGNVVVTENFWAHLALSTGFAAKYGTTVIAKTTMLPEVLATAGCG
jgi:hypothetical protein